MASPTRSRRRQPRSPVRMTIFDDSTELSRALCDEFEKHAVRGLEKLSCLEKGLLGHGRRRRPSYKVNAGPQHLSFRGRTVDAFNHTFTPRQACLVAHYSPKGSVPGRFTWNTDASDVADIRRQAPDIPEFHSDSVLVRQKDAYRLMIVMIGMLRADGVYFARVSPDSDAVDVYIMRDERLERVKLHDDSALLQYTDRSYRQLTAKFAVNAREVMLRYVNEIASLTKATETDDDGNVVKLVITDASDASITYEYDARGRLVNTIFKDVQCDDSLSDEEYDDEDSDDDDSDDDVWSLEDQDRADDIPEEDDSDVPVLEALPAPRAPMAPEVAPDMAAQTSPLGTLEQQLAAAAPLYPSYDSPLDPMPPGIIVPTASDLADNGMVPMPFDDDDVGRPVARSESGRDEVGHPVTQEDAGRPVTQEDAGSPVTHNEAGRPATHDDIAAPPNVTTTTPALPTDPGHPLPTVAGDDAMSPNPLGRTDDGDGPEAGDDGVMPRGDDDRRVAPTVSEPEPRSLLTRLFGRKPKPSIDAAVRDPDSGRHAVQPPSNDHDPRHSNERPDVTAGDPSAINGRDPGSGRRPDQQASLPRTGGTGDDGRGSPLERERPVTMAHRVPPEAGAAAAVPHGLHDSAPDDRQNMLRGSDPPSSRRQPAVSDDREHPHVGDADGAGHIPSGKLGRVPLAPRYPAHASGPNADPAAHGNARPVDRHPDPQSASSNGDSMPPPSISHHPDRGSRPAVPNGLHDSAHDDRPTVARQNMPRASDPSSSGRQPAVSDARERPHVGDADGAGHIPNDKLGRVPLAPRYPAHASGPNVDPSAQGNARPVDRHSDPQSASSNGDSMPPPSISHHPDRDSRPDAPNGLHDPAPDDHLPAVRQNMLRASDPPSSGRQPAVSDDRERPHFGAAGGAGHIPGDQLGRLPLAARNPAHASGPDSDPAAQGNARPVDRHSDPRSASNNGDSMPPPSISHHPDRISRPSGDALPDHPYGAPDRNADPDGRRPNVAAEVPPRSSPDLGSQHSSRPDARVNVPAQNPTRWNADEPAAADRPSSPGSRRPDRSRPPHVGLDGPRQGQPPVTRFGRPQASDSHPSRANDQYVKPDDVSSNDVAGPRPASSQHASDSGPSRDLQHRPVIDSRRPHGNDRAGNPQDGKLGQHRRDAAPEAVSHDVPRPPTGAVPAPAQASRAAPRSPTSAVPEPGRVHDPSGNGNRPASGDTRPRLYQAPPNAPAGHDDRQPITDRHGAGLHPPHDTPRNQVPDGHRRTSPANTVLDPNSGAGRPVPEHDAGRPAAARTGASPDLSRSSGPVDRRDCLDQSTPSGRRPDMSNSVPSSQDGTGVPQGPNRNEHPAASLHPDRRAHDRDPDERRPRLEEHHPSRAGGLDGRRADADEPAPEDRNRDPKPSGSRPTPAGRRLPEPSRNAPPGSDANHEPRTNQHLPEDRHRRAPAIASPPTLPEERRHREQHPPDDREQGPLAHGSSPAPMERRHPGPSDDVRPMPDVNMEPRAPGRDQANPSSPAAGHRTSSPDDSPSYAAQEAPHVRSLPGARHTSGSSPTPSGRPGMAPPADDTGGRRAPHGNQSGMPFNRDHGPGSSGVPAERTSQNATPDRNEDSAHRVPYEAAAAAVPDNGHRLPEMNRSAPGSLDPAGRDRNASPGQRRDDGSHPRAPEDRGHAPDERGYCPKVHQASSVPPAGPDHNTAHRGTPGRVQNGDVPPHQEPSASGGRPGDLSRPVQRDQQDGVQRPLGTSPAHRAPMASASPSNDTFDVSDPVRHHADVAPDRQGRDAPRGNDNATDRPDRRVREHDPAQGDHKSNRHPPVHADVADGHDPRQRQASRDHDAHHPQTGQHPDQRPGASAAPPVAGHRDDPDRRSPAVGHGRNDDVDAGDDSRRPAHNRPGSDPPRHAGLLSRLNPFARKPEMHAVDDDDAADGKNDRPRPRSDRTTPAAPNGPTTRRPSDQPSGHRLDDGDVKNPRRGLFSRLSNPFTEAGDDRGRDVAGGVPAGADRYGSRYEQPDEDRINATPTSGRGPSTPVEENADRSGPVDSERRHPYQQRPFLGDDRDPGDGGLVDRPFPHGRDQEARSMPSNDTRSGDVPDHEDLRDDKRDHGGDHRDKVPSQPPAMPYGDAPAPVTSGRERSPPSSGRAQNQDDGAHPDRQTHDAKAAGIDRRLRPGRDDHSKRSADVPTSNGAAPLSDTASSAAPVSGPVRQHGDARRTAPEAFATRPSDLNRDPNAGHPSSADAVHNASQTGQPDGQRPIRPSGPSAENVGRAGGAIAPERVAPTDNDDLGTVPTDGSSRRHPVSNTKLANGDEPEPRGRRRPNAAPLGVSRPTLATLARDAVGDERDDFGSPPAGGYQDGHSPFDVNDAVGRPQAAAGHDGFQPGRELGAPEEAASSDRDRTSPSGKDEGRPAPPAKGPAPHGANSDGAVSKDALRPAPTGGDLHDPTDRPPWSGPEKEVASKAGPRGDDADSKASTTEDLPANATTDERYRPSPPTLAGMAHDALSDAERRDRSNKVEAQDEQTLPDDDLDRLEDGLLGTEEPAFGDQATVGAPVEDAMTSCWSWLCGGMDQ